MTPQEKQRLERLEALVTQIVKADGAFIRFNKNIALKDSVNFVLSTTTGNMIGTTATQKLSVFGATPAVQAANISAPGGGTTIDTECRAATSSILTAIKNFGIVSKT